MTSRPCLDCGRITDGSRCDTCRSAKNRTRDQQRGTSTERGYDAEHQAERTTWEPRVATGRVVCRRYPSGQCVAPSPFIDPAGQWHLGHPDRHCDAPKAPEHVVCNVGAPRRGATA